MSGQSGGFLCLIASVSLAILRKKMSKALSQSIGGSKRLNALSTAAGAVIITPFAFYSWITANDVLAAGAWDFFEALGLCVVVFMVVGYYIDTLIKPQLRSHEAMRFGLGSGIIACYILEVLAGDITFTFLALVACGCVLFGQHLIFKVPETSTYSHLGSLDSPHHVASGSSLISAMGPLVSQLFERIRTNKDARNIFIYMSINLLFMFVEMAYGWWNNSLGLISDGVHMLFDCMALMIGLIALVIQEWAPNQRFSFGYGRVNILSGFINAIFLVFIASSVFYEAIHRFIAPQEIDNDNLLLVSVLGLLVNLLGLFVFSQAHHAAHGHSHSSHGHSHSASSHTESKHGHSHSESHDHGHGHGHGHDDHGHDDHGHGHGHGHDDHGHGHGHGENHGHAHGGHDHGHHEQHAHDSHEDEHEDENMKGVLPH